MAIAYDPRIESLIHPERRETVFQAHAPCSRVQLAVEGARLAYYKAEDDGAQLRRLQDALQRVGYSAVRHFDTGLGTQAFAAFDPVQALALVAFRGTEADSIFDIGIDASALPTTWTGGGRVHSGFAAAFGSVRAPIEAWLATAASARRGLLLCGHSLGAALAALAASVWRPAQLITIGSPRVGDARFVESLADVDAQRIVNGCDVVTGVPPAIAGYAHLPRFTYIDCNARLLPEPADADIQADRHRGRDAYSARHALRPGNVPSRDLADHAPVNYLRAFFA